MVLLNRQPLALVLPRDFSIHLPLVPYQTDSWVSFSLGARLRDTMLVGAVSIPHKLLPPMPKPFTECAGAMLIVRGKVSANYHEVRYGNRTYDDKNAESTQQSG